MTAVSASGSPTSYSGRSVGPITEYRGTTPQRSLKSASAGVCPAGLTGEEFYLLRPLVESLVHRKELRAEALDAFDG